MKRGAKLSDPTADNVRLWLKTLDRNTLHNQGWVEANSRFHGITQGMRAFINQNYSDPKKQEAALRRRDISAHGNGAFRRYR